MQVHKEKSTAMATGTRELRTGLARVAVD